MKVTCPNNPTHDARYYEGALGYEAIQCRDCMLQFDLNSDAVDRMPERLFPMTVKE